MNAQMARRYEESQRELYRVLNEIWEKRIWHSWSDGRGGYMVPLDADLCQSIRDALGEAPMPASTVAVPQTDGQGGYA